MVLLASIIGLFMQHLWPFTALITMDACTHAFHIYIIEVTEKQMQIAFIVFFTWHPVVFHNGQPDGSDWYCCRLLPKHQQQHR